MRAPMRPFALAVALLAFTVAPAPAETIDVRATALGWQAEQADVVVRARLVAHDPEGEAARRARFSVVESLKGANEAGGELELVLADGGHGFPWRRGRDHLLFLRRTAGEGAFRSVGGALGVRVLPAKGDGAEREFPRIVARHLAAFGPDGRLDRPDDLRTLLVELVGHADPGIAGSGALDLVRHRSLHPGLTAAQRLRVLDAYRTHPRGKSSKHALATALAHARPPGAADALLESVAASGGRPLRGSVADALAILGDPDTTRLVTQRMQDARPEALESLLVVLGTGGDRAALPAVRRQLLHASDGVRAQAAHAFGRIARAVREAHRAARRERPDLEIEPLPGMEDLVAFVVRARSKNEWRAGTWALAQLDRAEAYAHLRRLAKDDPRADVRRYARRFLERPRLSLVLR